MRPPNHGGSRRFTFLVVRLPLALAGGAAVALALTADRLLGGQPGLGAMQWGLLLAGLAGLGVALLPLEGLRNALLAGATVGLALLAAEAALRLFLSHRLSPIYRAHPSHLLELIPGSERAFTRGAIDGGQTIRVRVNHRGFRGEEIEEPRRGRRVVVYGDSFVAAEFSALEATFVERLEDELATGIGTPVEAINAGVVGYGPDQIVLRMEAELAWLAPDLVVVAICADNDFGDLLRNKLFDLDGDGRLVRRAAILAPGLDAWYRRASHSPFVVRLAIKALRAGTTAGAEGHDRIEHDLERCRSEYREFLVRGDSTVHNLLNDHYDADVSLDPGSESARFKLRLMEGVVGRMVEVAARHDVPLVLVAIPSAVDVCEDHPYGRVDAGRHPDYRPENLAAFVEAIAARRGVPAVSLMEPFVARGAGTLYFRGHDNHWNDEGQALGAHLVADGVLDRGLLGAAPADPRPTAARSRTGS